MKYKIISLLLSILFIGVIVSADSSILIHGTVTEVFMFLAEDGKLYEIEENDLSDLIIETIGQKVTVKCLVKTIEETLVIEVLSFKVIEH